MKRYRVKECFHSLQGEGVRAGSACVFLRFSGCNVNCREETHGFDCDTQHEDGEEVGISTVVSSVLAARGRYTTRWVVLTGGEPAMQVDGTLLKALKAVELKLAIETNGTIALPPMLDWITVSPKRDTVIRQGVANEVKFVLQDGDPLPTTEVRADTYLLSPAFDGDALNEDALRHCIRLCLENPRWKLSLQQHKIWRIR